MVKSMVTTVLGVQRIEQSNASTYVHCSRNVFDSQDQEKNGQMVWKAPPDYTEEEISLHRRLLMETLPKVVPGT